MSGPDVFISYKREDEARVKVLVDALTSAGLTVWWDRQLPGASSWRQELETNLEAARCVVVVWSHQSTGPAGEFVHDEASRAMAKLVPVHIDRVRPPLGFGERQSLDLVGWRGSTKDVRFVDVVDAVKAAVEGRSRPVPRWPRVRLLRVGGASSVVTLLSLALGLVTGGDRLQQLACQAGALREWCGEHGLGGVPSRAEQAAFDAALQVEDDSGLRAFLKRFPSGALAAEAQRRLAACHAVERAQWRALPVQRLELYVPRPLDPVGDQATARARALEDARGQVPRLCSAHEGLRVLDAGVEVDRWDCSGRGRKVSCGLGGTVQCQREMLEATAGVVCAN